jgi:predicted CoA-binding protein
MCCDMRLVQIRNEAAPLELVPKRSVRNIKLISNQIDLLNVYIASRIRSEIISQFIPMNYNINELPQPLK